MESILESGSDGSWQSSKAVQDATLKFHHNNARQPKMDNERGLHKQILDNITDELKKEGIGTAGVCSRAEYAGSSYSGVKIPSGGAEFDVLTIIKGGDALSLNELPTRPGYYRVPVSADKNPFPKYVDENGELSPTRTRDAFKGRLNKIVNNLPSALIGDHKVKLKDHGPAIQMDVSNKSDQKLYSVDIVPAFEVNGNMYVAKPFKAELAARENIPGAWHISYSLDEKKLFNKLDRGNGCRKQALRVCKAMLYERDELQVLTSHHLKHVLFYEAKELNQAEDWKQDKLGERVIGLWKKTAEYVKEGNLPCYFNDQINLIEQLTPEQRENVGCRIERICTKEKEFMSLINGSDAKQPVEQGTTTATSES